MAREKSIKIRLTTQEYDFLKAEAERQEVPAAEVIRDLLKHRIQQMQTS